ncbi:hypothetical protein DMB38_12850 [Streptomyces sp. WAC 06738]|uniref:hypothetical protein n=1 Tax=Streptomyces sp. WAC 06738 TaxID=2203210 RepID=UPI000F6F1AF8|nr:hypothetical protein [Streptomyces sp. WAC 06738]AZM46583.1 hypothetical protein DMB38_12850 [Streptomyces sp. WAC 06738]
MRVRILTTTLAAAFLLAGTGCSDEPSYEEIAERCAQALADRAPGVKGKPADCEGLSEEDYGALLGSQILKDESLAP